MIGADGCRSSTTAPAPEVGTSATSSSRRSASLTTSSEFRPYTLTPSSTTTSASTARSTDGDHDFTGVEPDLRPPARPRPATDRRDQLHATGPRQRSNPHRVRVPGDGVAAEGLERAGNAWWAISLPTSSTLRTRGGAHRGFEIWNEANLEVFLSGTRDEYLRLYDLGAGAVKAVDADLPVGGPASAAAAWIDELLAHGDTVVGADRLPVDAHLRQPPLDLRPIAARHGRPDLRLWWTDGAPTPRISTGPTIGVEPAYLARGIQRDGRLDALAYSTVSDHFEELGRPTELLHGGFGLRARQPAQAALVVTVDARTAPVTTARGQHRQRRREQTWSTPSVAPTPTGRWRSSSTTELSTSPRRVATRALTATSS